MWKEGGCVKPRVDDDAVGVAGLAVAHGTVDGEAFLAADQCLAECLALGGEIVGEGGGGLIVDGAEEAMGVDANMPRGMAPSTRGRD